MAVRRFAAGLLCAFLLLPAGCGQAQETKDQQPKGAGAGNLPGTVYRRSLEPEPDFRQRYQSGVGGKNRRHSGN